MKASVLCCLPKQRERLKHAFAESKSAGVPTASRMSATFSLFFFLITRNGRNLAHERSVSASQMTISKRCDVPSCFLFVFAVAGVCVCVCVCVCVLGSQFYVFALRME